MRSLRNISINIRCAAFLAILVCLFSMPAAAQPWAGSGTGEDPYQIWDACDMQAIGADPNYWDAHFKLMADIDLSAYTGTSFNIIGNLSVPFTGVFDGDNHTIFNFAYDSNDIDEVGLFGSLSSLSGCVRDVEVSEPCVSVMNGFYVAALVGYMEGGSINRCRISNGFISGRYEVGALVGWVYDGSVTESCVQKCRITGDDEVGGLTGGISWGNVSRCFASGAVNGEWLVGGLAGNLVRSSAVISDSYSGASVSGGNTVGGLLGINNGGSVSSCYAFGSVNGDDGIGAFMGDLNFGSVLNCFWDVNVNPDVNGIGNTTDPNVIGESTANMQTESTFTDAGWDFVGEVINGPNDIWDICEGTNYPKFVWQIPAADFVCPDGVEMRDFAVLGAQWRLEELSADVAPDGGDGIVNFLDWVVFADGWQSTKDIYALADFAHKWLKAGANYLIGDIAPAGEGDGIVNVLDFAALAENWLAGL